MRYLLLTPNGSNENNLCFPQTSTDFCGPDYNMETMNNMQQYRASKKVKRFRSAFTTDQVNYLEMQFKKFPYISNAHRKEVAMTLNIPERAVKIWFQNRRMKEKKDTGVKEFEDEHGNRKSLEFGKDRLKNVIVPSVNDQHQYSLPLLTDEKKSIIDNNVVVNNSCEMTAGKPTSAKYYDDLCQKTNDSPSGASNLQPLVHTTSVDWSVDLSKKYKTEPMQKLNLNKHDFPSNIKQDCEFKPAQVFLTKEQTVPEDLSSTRNMSVSAPVGQVLPSNNGLNNQGYFSVIPTMSSLYAQPYVSSGGVLWKPISVMPVVAPSTPSIQTGQLGRAPGSLNIPKKVCNCDCHDSSPISISLENTQNPQYIITALPFSESSTKY